MLSKILNQANKLQSRSKKVVFKGYSESQKGYLLYGQATNNFFHRDVIFKETLFSLKDKALEKPLFSSSYPLLSEEMYTQSQYSPWTNDTNFHSVP